MTSARWTTAVLLCACAGAYAAPACPPKPISFALFESGLMYSESSGDGIDKAVGEELARRSKCAFEFSVKPRARIWLELERGDTMLTGSAIRTDERDAYAWGVNYFGLRAELLVRHVHGAPPKSKEDFLKDETLRMGVARGFTHGDAMAAFVETLRQRNRVVDTAPGTMYDMLMRNRFDALTIYPLDAPYRAKFDLSGFTAMADWFPADKSVPRALLFSKKHFSREQALEWRALVQQMRDDGTLRKIFTTYAGRDAAEKLLQFTPEPP